MKLAGGAAGGYKLDIPQSAVYDDALNGAHDPQTGANNMSKIVADEAISRGHRPAQLERRRGRRSRSRTRRACSSARPRTRTRT